MITDFEFDAAMLPDATIPTGLRDLDEVMAGGGLVEPRLTAISGLLGSGKTTLALTMGRSAAVRGVPTLVATTEHDPAALALEMLAAETRVTPDRLLRDELDDEARSRVEVARTRLGAAPLSFVGVGGWTVEALLEYVHTQVASRGVRLFVLDCPQLLTRGAFEATAAEHLDALSRELKYLGKRESLAVVVTVPLNERAARSRGSKGPRLDDLDTAWGFAETSDAVIFVHREEMIDPDSPHAGEADLIIAKQRQAAAGRITIGFQPHYRRFYDIHVDGSR